MSSPRYSVVVPVFNRPQELEELLSSLQKQSFKDFEVIVVEDGSTTCCDKVVDQYRDVLTIQYFYKPNSGPGPSRNFGFSQANGKYFVIFDSDCIIPSDYFRAVEDSLKRNQWDAWGGPDRGHENFTAVQRAMAYTMSSVFTTGGIRGGKKRLGWFQPRSFNMGISRSVFEQTKGFRFERFAEDIEFSIRMKKTGFNIGLIPEAYVFHKRRTNLKAFYQQVFNFGRGRVMVGRVYPDEIKLTHWFPAVFFVCSCFLLFLPIFDIPLFKIGITFYGLYLITILLDSFIVNKNLLVALLSVPAALLQLWGYGMGFMKEKFKNIH